MEYTGLLKSEGILMKLLVKQAHFVHMHIVPVPGKTLKRIIWHFLEMNKAHTRAHIIIFLYMREIVVDYVEV